MAIQPLGNNTPSAVPRSESVVTPVAQKVATQVQTANAVQQAPSASNFPQVKQALESINKSAQIQAQGIEFTIDPDDDRTIVKVVDKDTKTVLRQIPTEEALSIARTIDKAIEQSQQGLLINQKA